MAHTLAINMRKLTQREYVKTLRDDLHSLEIYFKEDKQVKLLKTSHDETFFTEEHWSYYQMKSSKFLRKKLKLGKCKRFRVGKDKQFNCHIVSWSNGLAAICLTSRQPGFEMPYMEPGIKEAAKLAEGKYLTNILTKFSKGKSSHLWETISKTLVDNQRSKLRKENEALNKLYQEELIEIADQIYDEKLKPKSRSKSSLLSRFRKWIVAKLD